MFLTFDKDLGCMISSNGTRIITWKQLWQKRASDQVSYIITWWKLKQSVFHNRSVSLYYELWLWETRSSPVQSLFTLLRFHQADYSWCHDLSWLTVRSYLSYLAAAPWQTSQPGEREGGRVSLRSDCQFDWVDQKSRMSGVLSGVKSPGYSSLINTYKVQGGQHDDNNNTTTVSLSVPLTSHL